VTQQTGRRSGRGRFVTFEGGEGAGKTTQIRLLADRLRAAGRRVVTTREPGGTPAAEAIRNLLLSGTAKSLGPAAEAILFAAARADHVDTLIEPSLARGEWVLCDRFADSTRAYQGAAGIDAATIETLERGAVGQNSPDLTIILDVPAEQGMARIEGRSDPDRFERDDFRQHLRRREIFLEIAMNEPGRCRVVDASASVEHVAGAIWDIVRNRFAADEITQDG
jgi:dTMP kinase